MSDPKSSPLGTESLSPRDRTQYHQARETAEANGITEQMLEELCISVFAERIFNAYNEAGPAPWKTFDGRDVPRWHEITEAVREKWCAAVREAVNITDSGGDTLIEALSEKILELDRTVTQVRP